jgi:hypothetical protein
MPSRRQQGTDLRDFGFGQLSFLADHSRYNSHQPDKIQRGEIHSIVDERNLSPQGPKREEVKGRLLID